LSGWIKWEKDLETDPRVLRMARELKRICNASAFNPVTLVCGGLVRLWSYADTHIRDDDTLDLGAHEIDELIGIENFCSLIPPDWLREIDENTVELPGFQAHNGVEAKKRALTQKRVQEHRKRISVTAALPDQDQTKTYTKTKEDTSASSTPARKSVSRETDPEWMLDFKLAYPERAGDQGWRKAVKSAHARIAEGHTTAEFIEGAKRYSAFCQSTGKTGTEYVKQAATFLGPDKPFLQPWHPPPKVEVLSPVERVLRANGVKRDERVVAEQFGTGNDGLGESDRDVREPTYSGVRRLGS
jgi:hypothetical protein